MVVLQGNILVDSMYASVIDFTHRKVPCEEVGCFEQGAWLASPGEARVTPWDRLQAPTTSYEHNN